MPDVPAGEPRVKRVSHGRLELVAVARNAFGDCACDFVIRPSADAVRRVRSYVGGDRTPPGWIETMHVRRCERSSAVTKPILEIGCPSRLRRVTFHAMADHRQVFATSDGVRERSTCESQLGVGIRFPLDRMVTDRLHRTQIDDDGVQIRRQKSFIEICRHHRGQWRSCQRAMIGAHPPSMRV